MFKLVQYIEDGILHVCHSSKVKRNKTNNISAKYSDEHFYECNIICSNQEKSILQKLRKNLILGLPLVLLQQHNFCQKESVAEPSTEISLDPSTEMGVKSSDYQCEKREMEMKNCEIEGKESVAEPSTEISLDPLTEISLDPSTEMGVKSSDYQSEKREMEMKNCEIEGKKTITIHQIINVNEWYDFVIDPEIDPNKSDSGDNSVLTQIHNETNNNNASGILCTSAPIGTETTDKIKTHKSSHKQHACFYCKKKVFQISRHIFSVHSREPEVQLIKTMNVGDPIRNSKLSVLRNKGDFEYNKIHNDNIVVRKTTKADNTDNNRSDDYVPCPSCWGYFIKENLRHHKRKCSPNKGDRQLQGNARKLLNHIHSRACDKLRNFVVPDMFCDEIMNNILFDEVIILYGNYLCVKYTQDHLKNHVRAQLRLLGRLLLQAKVHNSSITCCKDLIQSMHCDTVRKAIDDVAELDPTRGIYKHPFNGRTLGTAIQKIVSVIRSESIKMEDDNQLKICEAFLEVYKIDIAPYLNRICALSEKKLKRIKHSKLKLPENDEIQQYFKYLLDNAAYYRQRLEKIFCIGDWKNLAQYLLVALAVFNCKRPGETQRLELEDFHGRQSITQKELDTLEPDDQLQADKYVRVGFGGKLGNATALLIDKEKILPGLLLILKYRDKAGVHTKNRFLFGAPSSTDEYKTFSTYFSHQLFLSKSGMNATSLSFTNLRYHLATEVSKKGSSQEEELRVSNYMSHDYNIHKNIYDQSALVMDITKVSKHLEASATVKQKKRPSTIISGKENMQDSDEINPPNSLRSVTRKRRTCNDNRYPKKKKKSEKDDPDFSLERMVLDDFEPDAKEVEFCLGKLQHRVSWTSLEKDTTRKYFQEELDGKKAVTPEKVKAFKYKYAEVMKNRTVPMIKQWIEMENKKLYRESLGIQETKPRYSTPERDILQSSTEKFSLSGSEPSLQELEEIIEKNPILKKRSAISLLAKFRHTRKNK